MSKLHYTENGHVIPILCEELTRHRRARKVLNLPMTSAPGTLYVLARAYPDCEQPLHIAVNGMQLISIEPESPSEYLWHETPLSPSVLQPG